MTIISEFFGIDKYKDREAIIRDMSNGIFHVEMYDDIGLKRIQKITNRTVQYAENCAENWVMGVIEE